MVSRDMSNVNALLVDPPKEAALKRPFPLNIQGLLDSVSIGVTAAQGIAFGKIKAVRVQDIARQKWFNWDNGVWDQSPSCLPGDGNLYVAVYAENIMQSGNLHLQLFEVVSGVGKLLKEKTEYVGTGAGLGIEWTGNMPAYTYDLKALVVP